MIDLVIPIVVLCGALWIFCTVRKMQKDKDAITKNLSNKDKQKLHTTPIDHAWLVITKVSQLVKKYCFS